jgi:predicted O-methyltransferase YrrM
MEKKIKAAKAIHVTADIEIRGVTPYEQDRAQSQLLHPNQSGHMLRVSCSPATLPPSCSVMAMGRRAMTPHADGLPLVSCIMPTCDRRPFVARTIRYFLRQDFPNKELIIVDDGGDAVGDLVPAGAPVRYVRLPRRATVGAKRNLACEHAAGPLIAHWDDDDWHAPRRLRCQVEALLAAGADLCGLTTLLFYDARTGQAWRFSYPEGQRPWLSGNSLLYTRAFWADHRFPDANVGEDSHFVGCADPGRLVSLPDFTVHVGTIHGQNVSPTLTGGAWWHPCPAEDLARAMGEDWADYRRGVPALSSGADGRPSAAEAPPLRNVFACLVHESPECVVDLVRNLRHLDPNSAIVLYNGSKNTRLLDGDFPFERYGAEAHPAPRPMEWGRLHDFAIDCMRFALAREPFDILTIVDSDQLALRPGYSSRLASYLVGRPDVGMLGNSADVQPPGTNIPPARFAHAETELWRPFVRRFPDGEAKFVHWSFWPTTVFTAAAARGLVRLFDEDEQLRQIVRASRIWATEEVILPTLVALLGYRVAANPCSYDFVKFRAPYSVQQLDSAMSRPDVFWAHPIPRRYEDPLRQHVRARFNDYAGPAAVPEAPGPPPLLLTRPILARMRAIEGWLEEDEADLLIGATVRALADVPAARAVVEVGSYCGRATVVLGAVVRAVRPGARVWAVDPHDGKLGAADRYVSVAPSLEKLKANVAAAGLTDIVEVVRSAAPELPWHEPVALLLIDGLHDYANVARDFQHFEPWLADGGYVAFHDYAAYFPGVVAFVHELLATGGYRRAHTAGTMVLLQKVGGGDGRAGP